MHRARQGGYGLRSTALVLVIFSVVLGVLFRLIDKTDHNRLLNQSIDQVKVSLSELQEQFAVTSGYTFLSTQSAGLDPVNPFNGRVSVCGKVPADGLGLIGSHELECFGPEQNVVVANDPFSPHAYAIVQWDQVPVDFCHELVLGTYTVAEEIWVVNLANRVKRQLALRRPYRLNPALCDLPEISRRDFNSTQRVSMRWIIRR